MRDTKPYLISSDFPPIQRSSLETLQVNLGYTCNQSCQHCHVNAGPNRKEQMSLETIKSILHAAEKLEIKKIDLTGGAPEMNPHFRYLVKQARAMNIHIIDRCNLTILNDANYLALDSFLAANQVEIVASLPCYTQDNVDLQRGKGVFNSSIEGLQKLNKLGYGHADTGLILNLMYNPGGAFLPPSQATLQADYKNTLKQEFNIVFNQLYTLTNMPIMRFGSSLLSKGTFEAYMQLLKQSFNQDNLNNLMCRSLISIDWQGYIYDCDFNQMLDIPGQFSNTEKTHISSLNSADLYNRQIAVADHCYGCTAGCGSSCGGTLN